MPSSDEKARRKELRHAAREAERDRVRQSLPMPARQMKELFDFVDAQLAQSSCDHTLRHTIGFLEARGIPQESALRWLQQAGGYCDCEVIMNAEEVFDSANPNLDDAAPV